MYQNAEEANVIIKMTGLPRMFQDCRRDKMADEIFLHNSTIVSDK